METTFCELRGKEVINVMDGKRLGRIIDIVFDTCYGKILGFVVPCYNKSWNIFKASDDIFIPFKNVCKIGDDVILVEIFVANKQPQIKGRYKTQNTNVSTLSNQQYKENINNNQNLTDNNISLQSPIQINNLDNQNSMPLYPENNMSYKTKDINQ